MRSTLLQYEAYMVFNVEDLVGSELHYTARLTVQPV